MDYYRIRELEKGRNILFPRFPSSTQLWAKKEPIFLPGEAKKPKEELLFLSLYEGRAMLISPQIRTIFQQYQKGGRYRPCAFGSVEQKQLKPYYLMLPRMVEALHEETQYYRHGEIAQAVLDKKKVGAHRVFGILSIKSIRLIIAEDVLEEILRKEVTGFCWERVRVK